jgi:DtxR family Mn-dependent transcriptional regulator
MISRATEDYLKAIYKLGHEGAGGPVTTGALAEALAVAAPSATGMLKKLAELHLVAYHPRRGVTLTPAGEKVALEVVRHHRLLEAYLAEALGYGWDEVHDEAEELEHVISERMEERIYEALGRPAVDCHGDPIPSRLGEVAPAASRSLVEARAGEKLVVGRVSDRDPGKLRRLEQLGLRLGVELEVVSESEYEGPIEIKVGGRRKQVPLGVARAVFVR